MLPTTQQRQLAGSLNAKARHHGDPEPRTQGGALSVTARFTGINDDVGNVVTVVQKRQPGTRGPRRSVSQALQPAIKTFDDAKTCMDIAGRNAGQGHRMRPRRRIQIAAEHTAWPTLPGC